MTVLVKFPKNTFNTDSVLEENFEYYFDMAEEGATTYSDRQSILSKVFEVVLVLFAIFIEFLTFIGIIDLIKVDI